MAVVVPCYDDGATLGETLASLAGQEPHELVIVDDGSTDEATLDELERLRSEGVRVLRQENAGLAAARMAGAAATSAPYVQPLDADDLLMPGALAALADALDAVPAASAAWGDVAVFGTFDFVVRSAERVDPWYLWYLDEIPPTPMVRRSVLAATGGWSLRDAYEDWDFWMKLAEHGLDGVRVPLVTVRYRRSEARMNAAALARHGELLAIIRARHEPLGAALRRNWLRSRAPLRTRLLFPLLERLPLGELDRHRARRLVAHPRQALAARRARRRGEARS